MLHNTSLNKYVKQLERKNFTEICPACNECAGALIAELLLIFPNMNVNIECVEDEIFKLKISV